MEWTDFNDTKVGPFETKRTCRRCLQKIEPGNFVIERRGTCDGKACTATFHEDCLPLPGEEEEAPTAPVDAVDDAAAQDADDSVTLPPETTPLATTADEEAAAAKQADDEEAAAAAAGTITPAQRQKLEHLASIKAKSSEADVAYANWCEAAATAKELKKVYEGRMGELRSIIRTGSAQTRLDFSSDDEDDDAPKTAPATAGEQPEWMQRPLSVLKLPESLINKLSEGAIDTLGHLKAFWDAGRVLNDLKGIGSEKAARVADAWANYAKEHPEVWGEDGPPAEEDDPFAGDGQPSAEPAADPDPFAGDQEAATPADAEDDDPFADDPPFEGAEADVDDRGPGDE